MLGQAFRCGESTMTAESERTHAVVVDAWLSRVANGLSHEQLVVAFERAFSALWARAHETLGEVTLAAIADRVLHNAGERYPILVGVELASAGLDCRELRTRAEVLSRDQLVSGIRFVLVEFLRVLGKLTAEILTLPLHAELSGGVDGPPNDDRKDREDPKS